MKVTVPTEVFKLSLEITERVQSAESRSTADIRNIRREFSKRIASHKAEAVIALAQLLLSRGLVHRFFAYELVQHHSEAFSRLNSRNLVLLGQGIDSWAAVDTFACYLSGPAWRENQVPDSLIERWARSKDRWWRRAAVASTVPLNNKARGGKGDTSRTVQICRLVVDDRDDMVVKALSWALRELSKKDRDAVASFVAEYKSRLAARVLREVGNKLATGLKNPRKK